ncbi:MAG: hypothetical protein LBM99_05275 [Bacillales bacterium]|jgi:hypothetical protein|nr:hypothetical protein [Bacillales bacterium]
MNEKQMLGSQTAKDGFANEKDIANKFNTWQIDEDAQRWLVIMKYNLDEIEFVKAVVLHGYKADVNVQITIKLKTIIDIENLSIKLVSNPKGFNQIDKRPVDHYNTKLNWNIPTDIINILKRFTGEIKPNIMHTRDSRRMFIDEFTKIEQDLLFGFIKQNKSMILNDTLRGRGNFTAEWMLVAQKVNKNARWVLKNINEVINFYDGEIKISAKGSIKIGNVLIQRKGGTPDPTSLQFKINPALLFGQKYI